MKHVFFVLGLVAAFMGLGVVTSQRVPADSQTAESVPTVDERLDPSTQPRIAFESKTIDFGSVAHGAVVKRSFSFKNAGPGELMLLGIRTSCGCTGALPSKRKLAPGESAEIAVAFDTSRKPGVKERQRHDNHVFITTNDRAEKDAGLGVTRLALGGDVISRYRVTPETGVVLKPFQKGAATPSEATVTIAPLGNAAPLSEASALVASPGLKVTGPRPAAKGGAGAIELVVSPDPGARSGPIDATITIKTGDAAQPEVKFPVRGQVLPPVQVMPARLITSTEQPPRPISLTAQFPLQVLGVEVVPDEGGEVPFTVTGAPAEPQKKIVLTPVAPKGSPERGGSGEIRVFIADRETPVVVIPYSIRDARALRAQVDAHRKLGIRVSPPEMSFGEVRPGQEIEAAIVVSRAGGEALAIQDVRTEPEGLLSARVEAISAGSAARVIVRAKPGKPGPIAGELYFRPRAGAEPVVVRISGRTSIPIVATPASFYLSGAEGASIVLVRADGKPLAIASARDESGTLEVASSGADAAGAARVTVKPKADAKGKIRGAVRVVFDGGGEELKIPVFGELN